ncbi:MAG: EamA family transporter [Pseudomonadota bacterium]
MKSKNPALIGATMALTAAALWGTTGTTQSFVTSHTSPYWIGALRLVVASVFFACVVVWGRSRGAQQGTFAFRKIWPWALLGGVAMAAYNLCFFAGVKATGIAAGTGVALGSGPVWIGLLESVIARRPPRPLWWWGTALAVTGIGFILAGSGGDARFDPLGIGLCLAAGLGYAIYTLASKHLLDVATPAVATCSVFTTAALIAVPVAVLISGPLEANSATWVLVGYLGVVTTGIAYLLFSHALRYVSVATCVSLSLAEPVTAFVLAIVVVGEQPAAAAYAGLGLVLAGLLLVVWGETRRLR